MTKLPENMEENTIEGMLPGDIGFTVPWAMWADENRDLYVHKKYTICKESFQTSIMCIERTKTGVIMYLDSIPEQKYEVGDGWSVEVGLPVEALK